MAELILVILFAGRNNILLWVTGWPMDSFSVFHKWIARTMVANAVIHSIAYTIEYIEDGYYYTMWTGVPGTPWWNWGIAATIIFCVMLAQSVHYLRALNYEIFLYVHIIFTIFLLPALWIHIIPQEGMHHLYATIAIWAFDHLIRVLRLLWSGVNSKADVKLHEDDIIEFKINYSQRWKFYPGSYVYIHVLRKNRFWQSHPFTLVTSPKIEDNGKIVIFSRVKKGVTKYMADYLVNQPDKSANVRVLVEGPYGSYHPLHHYDSVVLVAGGVGVTSIYSYAAQLRENQDKTQRMTFIWCVRNEQPLSWFKDQLKFISDDPRIEVLIFITQSSNETSPSTEQTTDLDNSSGKSQTNEKKLSITGSGQMDIRIGQPDLKSMGAQIINETEGTLAFLVCGPNRMNDDVRQTVAVNIVDSKNRVDLFEESFSW